MMLSLTPDFLSSSSSSVLRSNAFPFFLIFVMISSSANPDWHSLTTSSTDNGVALPGVCAPCNPTRAPVSAIESRERRSARLAVMGTQLRLNQIGRACKRDAPTGTWGLANRHLKV